MAVAAVSDSAFDIFYDAFPRVALQKAEPPIRKIVPTRKTALALSPL